MQGRSLHTENLCRADTITTQLLSNAVGNHLTDPQWNVLFSTLIPVLHMFSTFDLPLSMSSSTSSLSFCNAVHPQL